MDRAQCDVLRLGYRGVYEWDRGHAMRRCRTFQKNPVGTSSTLLPFGHAASTMHVWDTIDTRAQERDGRKVEGVA